MSTLVGSSIASSIYTVSSIAVFYDAWWQHLFMVIVLIALLPLFYCI